MLTQTKEEWAQAVEELVSFRTKPPATVLESTLNELRICLDDSLSWPQRLQL